jgi:hypothetical protein
MNLKLPGYTDSRVIDPSLGLKARFLKELHDLWDQKRGDGEMPRRADFTAEELMRFSGRVSLIDVESDPRRYKFRLIGSRITEFLGRDGTGRYIDELYNSDFYPTAIGSYEAILHQRSPVRAQGDMKILGKPYLRFESLDLPLAGNGRDIDMIIKATNFLDPSSA